MAQRLIEFACAVVIDACNRLLLQQRDDVPGILYPGRVGLFGGHRENGESFLQCVVREINEEIGYFVAPERFRHLVTYDGIVDSNGATAHREIFIAVDIPADRLVITEGTLLITTGAELIEIEHRLSPSASCALTAFLNAPKPR